MRWMKPLPFIILLGVWALIGGSVNPLFLPSVKDVAGSIQQMAQADILFPSLRMSLWRITMGTALSILISIPLALSMVYSKLLDELVRPLTGFMRFIPVTSFYPLLILWLGIDEKMKVIFIFLATFFYFFPTMLMTFKSVSPELIDTALTCGTSKFRLLTSVYLPAALPAICQSCLMMYGIGWTYIIIAENTNTVTGLGHLMLIGAARGRTNIVFAVIVVIIGVAIMMDSIGNYLIKRGFKWYFLREGGRSD